MSKPPRWFSPFKPMAYGLGIVAVGVVGILTVGARPSTLIEVLPAAPAPAMARPPLPVPMPVLEQDTARWHPPMLLEAPTERR